MPDPRSIEIGQNGRGTAIAVFGEGVDANHPFLIDKVVAEACFSHFDARERAVSLCPGGQRFANGDMVDISPGAARVCPPDVNGCTTGTHVAGVVAGRKYWRNDRGAEAGGILRSTELKGAAHESDIVALQVFSRFQGPEFCSPLSVCALAFTSSQIRALTWVLSQVEFQRSTGSGPNIVAVVLPFGGGLHSAPCDQESGTVALRIQQLIDADVAVFAPAGNNGFFDSISSPACISGVFSVGSVGPTGRPSSFSNWHPKLLQFLTHGENILSAVPYGGFRSMSGTAMAAALAAGTYAVLKSSFPEMKVNQIRLALKETGSPVLNEKTGESLPAIDIVAAYHLLKKVDEEIKTERTRARPTSGQIPASPGR